MRTDQHPRSRGASTECIDRVPRFTSGKQHTILRPFTLTGKGLHSGVVSSVVVSPLQCGEGIQFETSANRERVRATADAISSTVRCTVLACGSASIMTVEHLLSALAGCGVDNCLVTVDGPEIPALDGSAAPFALAISQSGLKEQEAEREFVVIDRPIWIEENGSSLLAVPSSEFRVCCGIHFPGTPVLRQVYSAVITREVYAAEIAPARTFGLLSEVEELRRRGLALGGSLENAVVIGEDEYLTPLRFPDEPVRHKVLDLIGDLSLIGSPLRAEVIALKSSHRLNTLLAQTILQTTRS